MSLSEYPFDVSSLWLEPAPQIGYRDPPEPTLRGALSQVVPLKLCSLSRVANFTEEYADAPESTRVLSLQLLSLVWALDQASPGIIDRWMQSAADAAMQALVVQLFGERLAPQVRADLLKAEKATKGQAALLKAERARRDGAEPAAEAPPDRKACRKRTKVELKLAAKAGDSRSQMKAAWISDRCRTCGLCPRHIARLSTRRSVAP